MLPDIDSLALFVRVAEMRNLTRAAEASFITVPAASRRLSLLEHQFKAQLFERHSRGMALTPAGDRLLSLASDVVFGVRDSLIADWTRQAPGTAPDGSHFENPWWLLEFDFVLSQEG